MRRLIAATLLALTLFLARPVNAQQGVYAIYTGSFIECYYLIFCFPGYWQYVMYTDGTFTYNDSTGASMSGWY
jgi:hypothetical protein